MFRIFAALSILVLAACGGGGGTVTPSAPTPPTNVRAEPGPGYVTLSWQDNSNDETGFVIYRDPGPSAGLRVQAEGKLAEVGANVAEYLDRDTQVGVEYRYRVAARNAQGESAGTSGSQSAARVEPGIELVMGTVNHGTRVTTTYLLYFMIPEADLPTEDVQTTLTGPPGFVDGQPFPFPRRASFVARGWVAGQIFTPPVSGEYTMSVDIGGRTYTDTYMLDASQVLPVPEVTLTSSSANSVSATWTAVPGVPNYRVSIYQPGQPGNVIKTQVVTDTSATFDGLELAPRDYELWVNASTADFTNSEQAPLRPTAYMQSFDSVEFSVGGETPAARYEVVMGTFNIAPLSGVRTAMLSFYDFAERPEDTSAGTLSGPAGWNGGEDYAVNTAPDIIERSWGRLHTSVVALSGDYESTITVDGTTYTASATLNASQILPAPQNIAVTSSSANAVTATWDAVPGARSYWAYIRDDPNVFESNRLASVFVATPGATLDGMDLPAGEYRLEVQAYNVDLSADQRPEKPAQYNVSYDRSEPFSVVR